MTWRARTAAVLTAILPLLALVTESPAPRSDTSAALVIMVAAYILAFGLWKRRRWAWWAGVVFAGLWLVGLTGTAIIASRLPDYAAASDVTEYYLLLALQIVLTVVLAIFLLAPATRRDLRPAA